MTKKLITITVSILLFIIVFLSAYFILTLPKNKGDFSVDSFAEEIELFAYQGDTKHGELTDYKCAAKIGKATIEDKFGKTSKGSVFEWMGCDVKYDKENAIYYIRTYHINPRMKGGAYDVLIKADGTVIAVWGEK